MSLPKFSVALIARNEAKTLPRLMESLKEFQERGGEVLLLDTGSTDGTPEVARSLGCKVTEVGEKYIVTIDAETAHKINQKFVWNYGSQNGEKEIVNPGDRMFDYSSARNFIASLASNDMVAMPDCDEIFTKFDIDKLNEKIEAGADQLEYNFVFSHDDEGNEMIKFKHSKFYNRTKMKWVGIIHEVLQHEAGTDVVIFQLGEEIIKLEHYQNVETNRAHYLTGLAYDCFRDPENDRNAHYLGRELMYTGRFNSAIQQLGKHIEMRAWPAERAQSYIFMGECNLVLGANQKAFNCFMQAINIEPNRREPWMKIAEYYYRAGMPDHVIPFVSAALQVRGVDFYANFQPYYEHLPHELLYWALWQKGEYHASKDHFDICMAYQPFNPKFLHDFRFYYELPKMSIIVPTIGRPEGLKRVIDSIKGLNYPQEKIEIIIVSDGEPMEWNGDEQITIVVNETRQGLPKSLKRGVEASHGDWIVFASNDVEFDPQCLMSAFKIALDNKKYFVAFNTQGDAGVSPDEGNICEHFMIHKKLIPKIGGEIFDTEFNHIGVDNLLWAKVKKLGQNIRAGKAVLHHYHFSKPGGKMDDIYQLGWNSESVTHDRELLAKKLLELESDGANKN